jgi:hypothetical protein
MICTFFNNRTSFKLDGLQRLMAAKQALKLLRIARAQLAIAPNAHHGNDTAVMVLDPFAVGMRKVGSEHL